MTSGDLKTYGLWAGSEDHASEVGSDNGGDVRSLTEDEIAQLGAVINR
jgi:hypothetical protein